MFIISAIFIQKLLIFRVNIKLSHTFVLYMSVNASSKESVIIALRPKPVKLAIKNNIGTQIEQIEILSKTFKIAVKHFTAWKTFIVLYQI